MSCIDISLINSYFDNELDEKNSHQVEEHVLACSKCSAIFNSYKTLSLSVKKLNIDNIEVSDSFINAIFEKIENVKHISFDTLSEYYDNEMNIENSLEIRNHLGECHPCEETYTIISKQSDSIKELDFYSYDEDTFLDSLMTKIGTDVEHTLYEDLSAYADNEIFGEDRIQILEHLENCAVCEEKLATINNLKKVTAKLYEPALNIGFSSKLIKSLEEKESKIKIFSTFTRNKFSKLSIAAAITAMIIMPFSRFAPVTQIAADPNVNVSITEHSENYIFSSGMDYKSDSIDIITETKKDDLDIEDIGL